MCKFPRIRLPMFLAFAFAPVQVVMTALVQGYQIFCFPVGMITIVVMQVYPLLKEELQPTGGTGMVLPF